MPAAARRHVSFLVWRDLQHPEGGGSELFVERVAQYLVRRGWQVTLCCAAYPGAPRDEVVAGVRIRRRGGRLTVYLHGLAYVLGRGGRRSDVVVDVQNGIPFFTPLVRRRAMLTLVHHLHREQWHIIYPGLVGRVGWWIESSLTPRLYRRSRYATVSEASRQDLVGLGIDGHRIDVVANGVDVPHPTGTVDRAASPTICVLGRLVPHKQVEHALDLLHTLRDVLPDLRVEVIGDGWWRGRLQDYADRTGVSDRVRFLGHVSNDERDVALQRAWLLVLPSVKEGWGIAITEAAAHGVPALAYRSAGGVSEAIVDGATGWLVSDQPELAKRAEELLCDAELREQFGRAARARAAAFSWDATGARFERLLEQALDHRRSPRR